MSYFAEGTKLAIPSLDLDGAKVGARTSDRVSCQRLSRKDAKGLDAKVDLSCLIAAWLLK